MINVLELLDSEEEKYSARRPQAAQESSTVPIEATEGICFEIDRGVLKTLLEKAIEVVPTKDIFPVLKNFQIRVNASTLAVVGTNSEASMIVSTTMSVETKRAGKELFPAKKLLDIVRESDSRSKIYIEVIGRSAFVVAGSASWEIALSNGKDFPDMPKVAKDSLWEVSRAEFLRALSTVRYAVSSDGRESLSVVQVKNGRFTACDGSRLQQARIKGLTSTDLLIPGPALGSLIKLLKSSDQESLYVGEVKNRIAFRVGTDVLLIAKTAASFPPLEQLWLMPALSNDQELRVEKSLLSAALSRVQVNASTEYSAITVALKPGQQARKGEMILSSCDEDKNTAQESIPAQWHGPKRELILHYKYLKDLLRSYPAEECLFLLGEDQKTKKSSVLLKDEELGSLGIVQQMVGVPASLRRSR